MDANEFIELLENPDKVEKKGVEELKKLSLQYPYSQPVQLLYTIRLSQSSEYLFNRQLGKTSILTDDRSLLFQMFESDRQDDLPQEEELSLDEKLQKEYDIKPPLPEPPEEEEEDPTTEHYLRAQAEKEEEEAKEPENTEDVEEEEETSEETSEASKPDLSGLSASERVQYILEENRKLREEFDTKKSEKPAGETAIEQRIREIRERSKELNTPASDKAPEQKEEILTSPEALDEIQRPSVDGHENIEAIEEGPEEPEKVEATEEIIEPAAAQKPDEDPVFTIEDDGPVSQNHEVEVPQVQKFDPTEEGESHSFSEWLERLKTNSANGGDIGATNIFSAADKPRPGKNIGKIQLFDSFVEKLPELKRKKIDRAKPERPLIDMTNIMNDEEDSLVTETLAKVYLRQKHYDKAIKAYEIMKLKYPEKSSFFADQISEIRKLINSK